MSDGERLIIELARRMGDVRDGAERIEKKLDEMITLTKVRNQDIGRHLQLFEEILRASREYADRRDRILSDILEVSREYFTFGRRFQERVETVRREEEGG